MQPAALRIRLMGAGSSRWLLGCSRQLSARCCGEQDAAGSFRGAPCSPGSDPRGGRRPPSAAARSVGAGRGAPPPAAPSSPPGPRGGAGTGGGGGGGSGGECPRRRRGVGRCRASGTATASVPAATGGERGRTCLGASPAGGRGWGGAVILGDAHRGCGAGEERDGRCGSPGRVEGRRGVPTRGGTAPVLLPHPTAANEVCLAPLKHTPGSVRRRRTPKTSLHRKRGGCGRALPVPEGSPAGRRWGQFTGALPGSGRRAAFPS